MSVTFNVYAGPCLKIPEGKTEEVRRLLDDNGLDNLLWIPCDGIGERLSFIFPNQHIPGIERVKVYSSRDRPNIPIPELNHEFMKPECNALWSWLVKEKLWNHLRPLGIVDESVTWAIVPYWL